MSVILSEAFRVDTRFNAGPYSPQHNKEKDVQIKKAALQIGVTPTQAIDFKERLIERTGCGDQEARVAMIELMSLHQLNLNFDRTVETITREPFQIELALDIPVAIPFISSGN